MTLIHYTAYFVVTFLNPTFYADIMLELCLMLSVTYYAQNYAGIIGLGLPCGQDDSYYITGKFGRGNIWQICESSMIHETKTIQISTIIFINNLLADPLIC